MLKLFFRFFVSFSCYVGTCHRTATETSSLRKSCFSSPKPKTTNRRPKYWDQRPKTNNRRPKYWDQRPKTNNRRPKYKGQISKYQVVKTHDWPRPTTILKFLVLALFQMKKKVLKQIYLFFFLSLFLLISKYVCTQSLLANGTDKKL